ncbi:hypothetical protein FRB94_012278 [Tulasnella sp. JGI-2019a]|nr:hypothetical protein FRB94_012278 [Tulasnella sp. JGI-2019a]
MGVYRAPHSARARSCMTPTRRPTPASMIATPVAAQPTNHSSPVEYPTTTSPFASTATAFSPNASNLASNLEECPHGYSLSEVDAKLKADPVSAAVALIHSTLRDLALQHSREGRTTSLNMGPKSPEISLAGPCQIVKDNAGTTIGVFRQGTALSQLIECALLLQDYATLQGSRPALMQTSSPSAPTEALFDSTAASVEIASPNLNACVQPTDIILPLPSPVTATDKAAHYDSAKALVGTGIVTVADSAENTLQPSPNSSTALIVDLVTWRSKAIHNGQPHKGKHFKVTDAVVDDKVLDTPAPIVEDNSAVDQLCVMMRVLTLHSAETPEPVDETTHSVDEATIIPVRAHSVHPEAIALGTKNVSKAKSKAKGSKKKCNKKPKKSSGLDNANTMAESDVKKASTTQPKAKDSKKKQGDPSNKTERSEVTPKKVEPEDEGSDDEMPALIVEDNSALHQITDMLRVLSLYDAEELSDTNRLE